MEVRRERRREERQRREGMEEVRWCGGGEWVVERRESVEVVRWCASDGGKRGEVEMAVEAAVDVEEVRRVWRLVWRGGAGGSC